MTALAVRSVHSLELLVCTPTSEAPSDFGSYCITSDVVHGPLIWRLDKPGGVAFGQDGLLRHIGVHPHKLSTIRWAREGAWIPIAGLLLPYHRQYHHLHRAHLPLLIWDVLFIFAFSPGFGDCRGLVWVWYWGVLRMVGRYLLCGLK